MPIGVQRSAMVDLTRSAAPAPAQTEQLMFGTLKWFCNAINSTAGVCYLVDPQLRQSHFLTYNVDLAFHRRYIRGLYQFDPLHPQHFPSEQRIVTLSDALPGRFRSNSDYFGTFVAPQNVQDIVEIFFRRDDRIVAGISLLKYRVGSPLSGDNIRLIGTVHPLIEHYLITVLSSAVAAADEDGVPMGNPFGFTDREGSIVGWVQAGLSNKQIARQLGIGVATVKTHVRAILSKTDTTSRATLLAKLFRTG
jgi:DNA-binding CsgD family transcriptional regulator